MFQHPFTGFDTDIMIGDARICSIHPNVKTSSPDGMFDAPCNVCESLMDAAYQAHLDEERLESLALSEAADYPPEMDPDADELAQAEADFEAMREEIEYHADMERFGYYGG